MFRCGYANPVASYRILIACRPANFPSKEFSHMMGTKEWYFAPLITFSLEALVPQDHFYQ
ncbi:MAG: hypothetical protein NVSMB27_24910 [Ktedonobacteraceae bacterium]